MKKVVSVLLIAMLLLGVFAGCGGEKPPKANEPEEPKVTVSQDDAVAIVDSDVEHTEDTVYQEELNWNVGAAVAMISPLNSASSNSQTGIIQQMIYDTLLERQLDGTYAPGLATEWSTEDYKTFNFKLREGVKFHNGNPFTADDVAYTIQANQTIPGALSATQWLVVESWEVVNDYEINMTLKETFIDFYNYMGNPCVVILDKESCEADIEHGPEIGTGCWKLVDFLAEDHIYLEAFDEYWGEPARAKRFNMRWVAEETAREIMFDNDEVDFSGISNLSLPKYENDDNFVLSSYVMNNTNMLAFNMAEPLCQDKNFRLAVAHAFDRQAYTDITLQGYGNVWDTGSIWGARAPYKLSGEELPTYEYNLELAKEYLAKTNYNGEELTVIASMSHPISNAQVFQEQMALIGINIDIFDTDGATQAANTQPGYTGIHFFMGSAVWGSLASSVNNYVTYGTTANKANYNNPYIEELVAKADMTPDGPEREAIYHEIQQIIAEDIPYLGIFNMMLTIGCRKGAGGVVLWPDNYHDYSHAYRIVEE